MKVYYVVATDQSGQKTDAAKFFERAHADEHAARLPVSRTTFEVEEREESAERQHEAHREQAFDFERHMIQEAADRAAFEYKVDQKVSLAPELTAEVPADSPDVFADVEDGSPIVEVEVTTEEEPPAAPSGE